MEDGVDQGVDAGQHHVSPLRSQLEFRPFIWVKWKGDFGRF